MSNSPISHILIGCPGSGKTTLANKILEYNTQCRIVSTDQIRKKLFGNESIQESWNLVESEVFNEIDNLVKANYSIVYDATNYKRPYRIELLQKLRQKYSHIHWIGWELRTPLEICIQRNLTRNRPVDQQIIEKFFDNLKQFPPISAEGFLAVYSIQYKSEQEQLYFDFVKKTLAEKSWIRTRVNRSNRTQHHITLHTYSKLIDFERLMYLISLIINYPGIGNLSSTDPQILKNLLDLEEIQFDSSIAEICAALNRYAHPVYVDSIQIAQDLEWLENNGFIGLPKQINPIKVDNISSIDLDTHPYSDKDAFLRLMEVIKYVIRNPFDYNKDLGALNTLFEEVQKYNYTKSTIRKDIEKILKPYHILPNFSMKHGYFMGTGILSKSHLIGVFNILENYSKGLDNPISLEIYETFKERMSKSQISTSEVYPVRAIYNRNIVDVDHLPNDALLRRMSELESAIEEGKCLELKRFAGGGRYSTENDWFLATGIQIVFHNIGWYLGYQNKTNGLFKFERLDRLFMGRDLNEYRDRQTQLIALDQLKILYESSGGIYLGTDPKLQEDYIQQKLLRLKAQSSKKTQSIKIKPEVETLIELWFDDYSFGFVSEGTKRFPDDQMKMSPPKHPNISSSFNIFTLSKSDDKRFPNRFQVILPKWSLEDHDLLRWIIGFGGLVLVKEPIELIEKVKNKGHQIANLYPQPS